MYKEAFPRSLQEADAFTTYSSFSGIQSSGNLGDVYAVLVDLDGEVVTSLNHEVLTFTILQAEGSPYSASFNTGSTIESVFGVFNISDVSLIAEPLTTATLALTTSAIDSSKPNA